MYRFSIIVVAINVLGFFYSIGYAQVLPVVSTFDTDVDGWTVFADANEIEWISTGGNPDGYASALDKGEGVWWFFEAPAKFLGDKSDAYGQQLRFDLRQSERNGQGDGIDILLESDSLTLYFDTPNNPGMTWTSYSVALHETGGWTKNRLNGDLPTREDMVSVLSSIKTLRIRGEFSSRRDRGDIDNVIMGDGEMATIRVADAYATRGSVAKVPIILNGRGIENALGFSLSFDATLLTNPSVSLGKDAGEAQLQVNDAESMDGILGIALALPSGDTFPLEDQELIVVDFDVQPEASVDSTVIEFIDQPIRREVSDPNASEIAASWLPGTVYLFNGYEGDVASRPEGNGDVSIIDWVQCGRFVAGLDTVQVGGNEFQRADTAPRVDENEVLVLGDGTLSSADWTQCGMYAAKLDPPTLAGGPFSAVSEAQLLAANAEDQRKLFASSNKQRVVRLPDEMVRSGEEVTLVVELEAEGDENALGFSLDFDPAYLTYSAASMNDSILYYINDHKVDSGRIGFIMALPAGETFTEGTQQFLNIRFTAQQLEATDSTTITFTDNPIIRETSGATANVLASSFIGGTVTIVTGVATLDIPNADGFNLHQNYPNPFNSSTTIEYSLATPGHVVLSVFNLLGQETETLIDTYQQAGSHTTTWSSEGLESGIYFYQLKTESFTATRKLTVLR
ncbi:MAG: T9SS type A sorting domain-containing protein [Rhodothermaceae bacterium]|nr:T9SS type A sorting domain-containing protein [Rhodothermaceae bacterium]